MVHPTPTGDEISRYRLVLSMFAEVATMEAALTEAALIAAALAPEITVRRVRAERYWKIEEYFDLSLDFGIVRDRAAFDAVVGKLATSWGSVGGFPDDLQAVWVQRDGGFILPSVRFAHLQWFSVAED